MSDSIQDTTKDIRFRRAELRSAYDNIHAVTGALSELARLHCKWKFGNLLGEVLQRVDENQNGHEAFGYAMEDDHPNEAFTRAIMELIEEAEDV